MQSILLSAVIDALEAMKAASKGVPNLMLRDLQSSMTGDKHSPKQTSWFEGMKNFFGDMKL